MKKILLISSLSIALLSGLTGCSNNSKTTSDSNTPSQNQAQGKEHKAVNPFAKNQSLLQLLKVDAPTLESDMKDGKSLADIGKSNGVSEDQIVNLLVEQRKDTAKGQGKTDDEINKNVSKWTDQIKKEVERQRKSADSKQ